MSIDNDRFRFGPLRSRSTSKPRISRPEPSFFCCKACGNVMAVMQSGGGRPSCCGSEMLLLEAGDVQPDDGFSYLIFGGLNENAVKASWPVGTPPDWIYLRTFTGGQLKFVGKDKRAPVIFALADEDAYAYCDKDPCAECTFRCKRGFELFFYFPEKGLLRIPLDRMSSHPKS